MLVVDSDLERARAVAERWHGAAASSLDAALAPGIDVVDVCLPTAAARGAVDRGGAGREARPLREADGDDPRGLPSG